MTNEEIKEQLKRLAIAYPNVVEVAFEYHGSGDSFDSYYESVLPDTESINSVDFENIFWHMVETADSNFNNEGSQGTVNFNLKEQTVSIEDYYNVVTKELNSEFII